MSYQILRSVSEVPLDLPATDFDLPQWLFQLTDQEYQACSQGHLAAGTSLQPDGTKTSINVESVGGHLMIQHYSPEIERADHLKLVSQSDCWLFRVWHVRLRVTWEIQLLPSSQSTCRFQNSVVVEHESMIMKVLTALVLGGVFLNKHNAEETRLFAQNLAAVKPTQSRRIATGHA